MLTSRWMNGAAALAVLAVFAPQAVAQSTGTEEVEKVTVTGQRGATGGLIVKERATKTRSTIDQKYIGTQTAGQSFAQTLNLLPGYNFTNNDAYGSSGGNVRMRGFDGPRISLTQDGIPLNDSGNYAIFTNQLIDPEYLSRATLNTGTTDVDSPTASATGGTINTQTRRPYEKFTVTLGGAMGEDQYERAIAVVDIGEFDGISAFAGVSAQRYDKFKGPGEQKKYQANGRILQKLGEDSYISLIGHYNENRNNNYRQITLAQFNDPTQRNLDFFDTCTRDLTPLNGAVDNDNAGSQTNIADTASCTNFFGLRINPSNTGNVRLQGNFRLTDDLRLTVDPSWQYVKATGGGNGFTFAENDTRLRGAGVAPAAGVDLNGDGDFIDTIRLNSTNLTNTSRYGVTTSLIWEVDKDQRLRVAYTGDFARHRQTAAAGRLYADGHVVDVWAGLDDGANRILAADGTGAFLRNRDRLSNADLNQIAFSYSGVFLEEKLRVDIGLRAPFFSRDLDQRCYTQMNSQTVRCTTQDWTDADADGIGAFTISPGGVNEWYRPYTTTFKYDKVLPNLGVSYEFIENHTVYASYAAGLSAPRTDNLYFVAGSEAAGVVRFPGVQPEETQAFDLGYRFQGSWATVSLALWKNTFDNYIIRSFDQDLGTTVDRNIGTVELEGFDFEVGARPLDGLMVYASASYNSSEVQEDIAVGTSGGIGFLPTKGKTLAETPEWTFAGRAEYTIENITLAVQGKRVGDRFATDVNDQVSPAYVVFDANAVLDLSSFGMGETELQVNGINIFGEDYLGSISSQTNAVTILDANPGLAGNQTINGSTVNYNIGAPQTIQVQVRTKF